MKVLLSLLLSICLATSAFSQTSAGLIPFPAWAPPEPRTKNWTIFAPKPMKGDNIFKDEAETWLSDAILKIEGGHTNSVDDKDVSGYINDLGQNLVKYSADPKRHYAFVVVNDEDANAFTVGSGRVYVNLGLLKVVENEDQLASILAHELGHDAFRHCPKTVTRQMFWMTGKRKIASASDAEQALADLLAAYEKSGFASVGEVVLGWSRFNELEADKAGFYNVFKAGYNPEEMKNMFRYFVAEEKQRSGDAYASEYFFTLIFGSHPPASQRVTALKWESNWVKMPAKQSQYKSATFDAMKARVKTL
jgi:predicted Zn-dependent protease